MLSYGSLRRPLRSIIKSIGSAAPSPGAPRQYVSSALAQPAAEDVDTEIESRHQQIKKSRKRDGISTVEGTSESPAEHLGQVHHAPQWIMKKSLETPQPDLNHDRQRMHSKSYERSYKSAQMIKAKGLRIQRQYQLERHGYDDSSAWPVVLNMLSQATTSGSHIHTKRMETIRLISGKRAIFKGDGRAAIAEIMQRTGSHVVHILHSSSTTPAFDALTLYGQPHENMEAMKLLPSMVSLDSTSSDARDLEPHMLQSEVMSELDNTRRDAQASDVTMENAKDASASATSACGTRPAVSVRTYWQSSEAAHMTARERLALRPQQWTTLKFTEYVDLLTARTPLLFRRNGKSTGIQTSDTVYLDLITHELCELFVHSTALKVYINSDATDAAFAFLLRHGELSTIHRIMSAIERSADCSLTVSNFNVLFAHAAKTGDVHNFRFILQTMLRHQIRPTNRTWLRFHELVCKRFTPKAAAKVAQRMRQKGLLASPKTVREMADNMILPALTDYMTTSKATVSHLLRAIDKTVNTYLTPHPTQPQKSWLTVSAANKMIHFLLSKGRQEDALTVLNEIRERDEQISTDTLNTFLTSKNRAFDLEGALAILQHFHELAAVPRHAISLDAQSFYLLFGLAHRNKFHNTMRVIWRYACVSGHMPRLLPQMAQDSLYSHLPAFQQWEKLRRRPDYMQNELRHAPSRLTQMIVSFGFWGKFAVGISQGVRLIDSADPLSYDEIVEQMTERRRPRELSPLEHSIMEFARRPRLEPIAGQPRPQALKTALQDDLKAHLSLTPVLPFLDMLRRAWELDKAMKKAKLDSVPTDMRTTNGQPEQEQELQAYLADMLENMFLWGLHIPMKVGATRAAIRL
nr:pentatricopeptide repeat-containing protein [Quercus suber]